MGVNDLTKIIYAIDSGGQYMSTSGGNGYDNQTVDQMNRWQNPGDITNVPQARLGKGNGVQNSTRYLEKNDFVRLRNFSLGYSFDKNLISTLGVNKLRIYVSAINLLTFSLSHLSTTSIFIILEFFILITCRKYKHSRPG
jgi:hypothetical protein